MKQNAVYIHFENRPTTEQLKAYFAEYPAYRKVFATSYSFQVDYTVSVDTLRQRAIDCFPNYGFSLCVGKFYTQEETGL